MMNHGSILGNGAYFGVDYTAGALDLKGRFVRAYYARSLAVYQRPLVQTLLWAREPGDRW